jgi:regulator of sigma E protease
LARPVGPIGIARIVGGAAESIPSTGFWYILQLMAILSVNLAVVNILPLPGLDGGRLVFVFIEWLRGGKRLNPQREGMIHFAGLMLLVGLIVVITFFDIVSPAPIGDLVP